MNFEYVVAKYFGREYVVLIVDLVNMRVKLEGLVSDWAELDDVEIVYGFERED